MNTVSYLVHHDDLLQNATKVYYKMRELFYDKMRHLLQIETILLRHVTVITKYDVS